MDSQKNLGGSGNLLSIQFAMSFADKYLNNHKTEGTLYFAKLYLKLLLAKKDFDKARSFIE